MSYTVIYEDVNGTEWVPYDWKPDHEYIIFTIAGHKGIELDSCRIFTFSQGITPAHRGFMMRTIDGYLVADQVTKGFRSIPDPSRCPIVKIIEKPLNVGPLSPSDDNDNWELFYTADGSKNPLVPWEDDYEYVVHVAGYYNMGPYYGVSWVSPGYAFIDAEQRDISTNTLFWRKETTHVQVLDGYISFVLAEIGAANSATVVGRRIKCYWDENMIGVFQLFRRKIRKLAQADTKYNGWKVSLDALPAGRQIGSKWNEAIPFAWENGKEYGIVYSDPWGDAELSSGWFHVDSIVDDPALKARWNWNLFGMEAGSSAPIALAPAWFNNKNFRQLFSWGEWGPRVYRVYEKLPRLDPPIVLPDPDPPQTTPCADRCYLVGDVWEQFCTVEVRFIDPPDWQQREYEYEWGGDLGGGLVELVETLEGGRIAKIRLVRTLEASDNESTLPVTINVTVVDKKYAQLGMKDSDEAILTFELPCVNVGNSPAISIEDLSIVEMDANRSIDVRVFLNETYVGSSPMCVDWKTVDGTASSDLSVRALAFDDTGKPFITVIENLASSVRTYIDGAFPKFYNQYWADKDTVPKYMNTQIFTQNLIGWLSNGKTGGSILLLGDNVQGGVYDVKRSTSDLDGLGGTGFKDYFQEGAASLVKTIQVMYVDELNVLPATPAFLNGFDCIIYISSLYSGSQQFLPATLDALKQVTMAGLGLGVISDHGEDADGLIGFYRGANEVLNHIYGIKLKGSIDRSGMNLTVEAAIAGQGTHPLWTGMTGQINSGDSEAYVDATDKSPDYVAASGTVCFNSGEQEKTIQIQIIGDNDIENNEQFTIELSNNTKGTIAKAVGTITIQDDDAEPCGVATPSGGDGVTETWHYLGADAGYMTITYNMYQQPDGMEVFYENQLVGSTNGFVSDAGSISFYYPGPPNDTRCLIRVTGSGMGTAWDYQLNCPVAVPTQLAFIYGTSAEADSKMALYVPASQQSIFDTWARTDANDLYANASAAPPGSAAAAWQLLGGAIYMPDNLSSYTAFVSPNKYSNYTFSATMTSPDADDDLIGLLIGSAMGQDGILRTISIGRTGGGMRQNLNDTAPTPYTFGLFFVENGSVTGTGPTRVVGNIGNWDGQKARIEVVRAGNMIRARTTLFYTGPTSPGYESSSLMEIDLTSDPAYAPFLNENHYGYMVRSQAGSTFSEVTFTGDVVANKIYDVQRNATFVYDEQSGQWTNVNRLIKDDAGYPVILENPETSNKFLVTSDNITSA